MTFLRDLTSFVLVRLFGYAILMVLFSGGFFLFYKIMMAKYGM